VRRFATAVVVAVPFFGGIDLDRKEKTQHAHDDELQTATHKHPLEIFF
jgi:hypothetical protein